MNMPKCLTKVIDETTWMKFCNKLPGLEAVKVLCDVLEYVAHRLGSRVQGTRRLAAHTPKFRWLDGICFLSQGREILTVNVTRKGLRIYFHLAAGIFLDPKERFEVERMNFWKSSYHKKTSKYGGFTVWVSKGGASSRDKETVGHDSGIRQFRGAGGTIFRNDIVNS